MLDIVPKQTGKRGRRGRDTPTSSKCPRTSDTRTTEEVNNRQYESFGDEIERKGKNILRIGFQNVGGLSAQRNTAKDDMLRVGIGKYDFDIFGLSELNVNWRHVPEQDRLFYRTRSWGESIHLATANNCTSDNRETHQYGGTAIISIGKATHRVDTKGADPTNLGRWVWV